MTGTSNLLGEGFFFFFFLDGLSWKHLKLSSYVQLASLLDSLIFENSLFDFEQ